jgi:sphingolipid delta-4 desaturase
MVDTDMPCKFEAMCLNNVAGKTFFASVQSPALSDSWFVSCLPDCPNLACVRLSIFQILFYALRPGFIRSQGAFTRWHALNFAVVLSFNAALVKGTGSWSPLVYLLMSSFMAGSLHPLAGHFIGQSLRSCACVSRVSVN